MSTKLTKAQTIRAGAHSSNPSVKKAYEKLQFTLSLAHTSEELEQMGDAVAYHMRIAAKSGDTYDALVLRWCEDEMVIYAPRSSMLTTGTGNLLSEKEPAIMYIQTDSQERNYR